MEPLLNRLDEQIRRMTPIAAPPEQQGPLAALARTMERIDGRRGADGAGCELVGPGGERIPIPPSAFYVLERVAEVLARGDSITVVPVGRELTTQQAADLLNVSRQYLVRLLDDGKLPFRKTGKHRRVRIEDVLAFKDSRDRERRVRLRELTRLSEDAGGYDPEVE
jgi:excisionase family DNA binding protein